MRNLKRALSLTLASVMLLGMMVVGAGAAGFPDVADDNDNVEAIEVLQAIEVMVGNADTGNFEPDRSVTRTEMAVVMANLLKLDYKYYEASCPFWDVPTWAKSYVGACYANKITSGYGDGTYGALDPITPVQAASMMMRALGYFQYSEDYKDGFETATVRQGTQIGIFEGIGSSADKDMTRGQVARMALNALESEMVTFTGTPGSTYTASNGESITVGYVAEYTSRTSTELKYKAIEDRTSDASLDSNHRGQYYIQLGEELYNGKLTKKYARDDFERPSINWQYDGKDIGTYVDYELLVVGGTFTTEVTGSELYDLLTYSTIRDNDLLTYVDGVATNVKKEELVRSNKNGVNQSGTGVLTEVFVDQSRDEVIITGINTYLAKANSNYNKTNESLSLKVYTGRVSKGNVTSNTKIVDGAVVPQAADVQKDDYKLVYMSGKESNGITYDVVRMFDTNIVASASITKWSKNDNKVVGDFTANGENYKTNVKAFYDGGNVLTDYNEQLLTDMSYNIYEDRYGNAIGVDLAEGTKNYVFITGYDRLGSNISVRTADAAAIFLDGTMDVITVNVTDTNKYIEKSKNGQFEKWQNWDKDEYGYNGRRSENRWYTYTVNNNGVYTLKPVERFFWTDYELEDGEEKILNTANLFVDDSRATNAVTPLYTNQGRAYGNDNSIYITVDVDEVDTSVGKLNAITDVQGVYTGAQNVKLELNKSDRKNLGDLGEKNAAYVYSIYDNNYYLIASVVLGEAQGAVANYAYILGDAKNEWVEFENANAKASGDATYYWEFDAVLNGEKTTLTAKTKYASVFSGLEKFHVQELRFDGDYVVKIADVKADKVMTENNVPVTDKMDVYDVGHVTAGNATGKRTDTGNEPSNGHADTQYGYSSHRLDGTIELVGRSLYVERGIGRDVGLALTSDAKAVLIQYENDKREVTSCGSVDEAVGRLADAEPNNDLHPGVQFRGRIVAALESNGAASWVVIISDTPLNTTDKDYNYNYSTTINNVEVRLVNSATSSVQNRNITATLDRNGELTIGIPVASNVVGASASRITATVDGVYRADEAHPVVTVRGVQNKQAQWTLSNYDLTEYNKIVVTIYNFDVSFGAAAASVVIEGAQDGLASMTSTPAGGWKVGDTFTVTAKAGYTVTVNGASKSGNTYTINSTYVVVTITKNQAPAGFVNVTLGANITEDNIGITYEDGTLPETMSQVKKNSKIILDPSAALKVTGAGVTGPVANDKGLNVWTITEDAENIEITANDGYMFNGMFWTDPDGYVVMPNSAARADARAYTLPNWVLEILSKKTSATITFNLKDTDGNAVVWTVASDDGKRVKFNYGDTTKYDLKEAVAVFTIANEDKEFKVEVGGDVPAPAADGITAKVELAASGKVKATFQEYREDGTAVEKLTAAQVAAALNNSEYGVRNKWAFTESDIDLTSTPKAVKGRADIDINTALGADGKAIQVYKVTYPGPDGSVTKLVPAAGVTAGAEVAEDVVALLDENTVTGTGITVTSHKTGNALTPAANPDTSKGQAPKMDTTYVAAVRLPAAAGGDKGMIADGVLQDYVSSADKKVLVANIIGEDGRYTPIKNGKAIQVGTKIYLTAHADLKNNAAGQGVKIAVNGDDVLTVNVDKDGKIPTGDNAPYFVIPAEEAEGKASITIIPSISAADAKIFVDGVELTDGEKHGTGATMYYSVKGMTGYSLAWKNEKGEWVGIEKALVAADGTGVAKLTPATLTDTSASGDGVKVDEKGEIHLVRAWTVDGANDKTEANRTWETYSTWAPTDLVNPSKPIQSGSTAVTKAYYPIGETNTIWVQAKNAGVILAAKDGSALKNVVPVTGVANNEANGKVQGVWEVPVTGNIDANSFISLVKLGDTADRKVEIVESVTTTAATDWLDIGGVEFDKTYGDKVTVTASWKAADGRTEKIAIAAQQIVVDDADNPTKMQFQVKLTSDTALTYNSSGTKADLGTITLTVTAPGNNPIEIAIPVSIKLGTP